MLEGKKRVVVLVILSMIAGLVYLTPFLRFSFYDQMKEALGLTDLQIGSIGFTYGLLNVIGYVPSGFLAEKFNTKMMLVISCIGMAAVTFWYSTYPGYTAIIIIHALYGVFSVWTFWSPYLKAIRSLAPDDKQSTIYGLSEGIRGVGQTIVSFICLGALGAVGTITAGFRTVLFINAAVFIVLAMLVVFLVPDIDKAQAQYMTAEDRETVGKQLSSLETLKKFPKLLTTSGVWICIAVLMCAYCLWNTINGYLGTYTTRVLNVPAHFSSVLSIIRSYLIVFIAGFTGGVIIDKFRERGRGLMIFYLLSALSGAAIMLTSRVMGVCILMTIVLAYAVNVMKSTYWSVLGDAGIPRTETGAATGVISLIAFTPDFFTSAIISRFLDYGEKAGNLEAGFNRMYIWILAWAAAGILSCFVLIRRSKQVKAEEIRKEIA